MLRTCAAMLVAAAAVATASGAPLAGPAAVADEAAIQASIQAASTTLGDHDGDVSADRLLEQGVEVRIIDLNEGI